MIVAKKRMTARERMAEELRKQREAETGQAFKKRLVRVRIKTAPFSVLHGLGIFYCGYCGKPMELYSSRPFSPGDARIPPLYYACRDRCPRSIPQRAEFVDKLVLQLIQKRITENFPEPKQQGDYEGLLEKFREIQKLQSTRLDLLTKMHYASYKRDQILAQIDEVKRKIAEIKAEIEKLFSAPAEENPLLYPLFKVKPEEINTLDLEYRRELVKLFIRRIRYFNEYLIVRMLPLTEEDRRKSDEMGRVFHINMRYSERHNELELPDKEQIEENAKKFEEVGPPEREIKIDTEKFSDEDIKFVDEEEF